MKQLISSKVFIIGLPRTGTTSICAALLERGARVAHTAFSQAAIDYAEVIADAPVFSDYPFLDNEYPKSKFIYLDRHPDEWGPSIKKLLIRIKERHTLKPTAFSPVLLHSYASVFGAEFLANTPSCENLSLCFDKHKEGVIKHFFSRRSQLLEVSLSQADCVEKLREFLGINLNIPHLNENGKISDWSRIKNPRKVDPNLLGANGRKYFSFEKG